jgi:uncharacterized protein
MNYISPVPHYQRAPIVDILRGWALFSVVLMNYSTIYGWNTHSNKLESDNITKIIETSSELLFGSKGWTLLAILFGYGFSILLKNFENKQQPSTIFFIKRMLWLFVFAFINTLFFGGDILNDYAFIGLVLLLFYKLNSKSLFIIGITILIFTPLLQSYLGKLHLLFAPKDRDRFYELYNSIDFFEHIKANLFMRYKWMLRLSYSIIFHLIQLGCFIIGVALQRSNILTQLTTNKKLVKKLFFISLFLSIALLFLEQSIEIYEWPINKYYHLYYPQALSIMAFTSSCIIMLYNSNSIPRLFFALQTIGKMTLTNYVIQNIIAFALFICFKPNWALHYYLLTGIAIYILQVLFSKYWLKRYNYGLLEWLWRSLSYGQMFQLKKQ